MQGLDVFEPSLRAPKGRSNLIRRDCFALLQLRLAVLAMTMFTVFLPSAYADVVYTKTGQELKGLVVEEHKDRIVLNTEANERSISRQDIDDIFYDDPERNYLYLGKQALEGNDFGSARLLFRKSLQFNPRFQEAADALSLLEDMQKKQAPSEKVRDPESALETRWGLMLEPSADRPLVKSVRKGSLADQSDIRVGDKLVSLWSDSLSFRPIPEVAAALLGPAGSVVKLAVQREISIPKGTSRSKDWPGLIIETERLGLAVITIEPGQAAASAGVRPGDRLTAVNDRSTRYLPSEEARRMIRQAASKGITLTIERDLIVKRQ